MKIFVKSYDDNIGSQKAKEILQESGIDKNFEFSHCSVNCVCKDWKIEPNDLLIRFHTDFSNIKLDFARRLWSAWLVCKDKINETHYFSAGLCSVGSDKQNCSILINTSATNKKSSVIVHELGHVFMSKHCQNPECVFFQDSGKGTICEDCKETYNKIISWVNS